MGAPREWTDAYDQLVRLFMEGRISELRAALATRELTSADRAELTSMVDFATGQMRSPYRARRSSWLIWGAWVHLPLAPVIMLALFRVLVTVGRLVCPRAFSLAQLRERLAPDLVHWRYANFVDGLVDAALLHVASDPETHPAQHAYYLGLVGIFECVSGCWESGLAHSQQGFDLLWKLHQRVNAERVVDAGAYERLIATTALRALYLASAGQHREAYRLWNLILELVRTHGRYVLVEVFLFSTRMSGDVETLDAESLARGAASLKAVLGEHYAGTFGLRAAACSGLIAAIQGNLEVSRQHLLELSYRGPVDKIATIELARFHYWRALAHLQWCEQESARFHATRAVALVTHVPGARFHRTDALLLRLEVDLRLRVRTGSGPLPIALHRRILCDLRAATRVIRGSELGMLRVRALRAFVSFLQGDYAEVQLRLPGLLKASERCSKRWQDALAEIDIRQGRLTPLATTHAEIQSKRDISLLERLAQLLDADAPDEDVATLFASLVGSDQYAIERHATMGPDRLQITMRSDPREIQVPIASGGEVMLFVLKEPLMDLRVDTRCRDLLKLVSTLVELAKRKRLLADHERDAAIVRTTQMLAHDIRRPFTTLRMTMDALRSAGSVREMRRAVDSFLPEVDAAVAQVTGLLADITHFGSDAVLPRENALFEELLRLSLVDALRAAPDAHLEIDYDLGHVHLLSVEPNRLQRAFFNIIMNAIQAMNGSGRLWIRTREVEQTRHFVEITIGNDGPPIAEDHLLHLFEPFFTRNKKHGTGLGLAIARQVAMAHGGEIGCRVLTGGGVEFYLTIPLANEAAETAQLARARAQLPGQVGAAAVAESREHRVDPEPALPHVCVVDDSRAVRASWRMSLGEDAVVHGFASPEAFWQAAERGTFLPSLDVLITDYRFLQSSSDGLLLARTLRERQPDLVVAVSTSGLLAESDIVGAADLLLDKSALSWGELKSFVDGARRKRAEASPDAASHG